MSTAISIQDLEYIYPGQTAATLHRINLEVAAGERLGLFGPNGAGKTTLINCITGLLPYSGGSVRLFDKEVKGNRKAINHIFGFVPQHFSFYEELSPTENLAFFGAWSGMEKQQIKKRSQELLSLLDLEKVKDKPVRKFSGGMKRCVNLAIGVMHSPRILILDEPTVGVDVHTRKAIINFLMTLSQQGTALVYTSHQLSEAEELCDKIAMIDEGKILAHDTLSSLLQHYGQETLEQLFINLTGKIYSDTDVQA